MSRIGKKPVTIPDGVKVSLADNKITISGPKGSLDLDLRPEVSVEHSDNKLTIASKGSD
jgi:large subunit ribosomal protein L6